jgi:two-component system, chemotaxis family, chemotaxis protein CheY
VQEDSARIGIEPQGIEMTILVVDDEPDYRLVIRSILGAEGHTVVLAEDGVEALEKLEEGAIDLVIADIYMPRMDGIKFHRKLRSLPQFEKMPVLFVSAFDDQHTMSAVKDPRFDGFLKKGRPIEELLEWVAYLATPEGKRPKMPPTAIKIKPPDRPVPRGQSNTPIY